MSEHPSNGPRPLIPGQVKSWLGVVAFVLVAVAVLGYAFVAIRPTTNADLDRRTAQKALRADTEAKAQALLTGPAKNADGTYRRQPEGLGRHAQARGGPRPHHVVRCLREGR